MSGPYAGGAPPWVAPGATAPARLPPAPRLGIGPALGSGGGFVRGGGGRVQPAVAAARFSLLRTPQRTALDFSLPCRSCSYSALVCRSLSLSLPRSPSSPPLFHPQSNLGGISFRLQSGWSVFVCSKRFVAGDAFIPLR
ncbi:uncharacterized protein [Miscanthus floridulus]